MRKAGISDYVGFARSAIDLVGDLPISLEVFSDDFAEMAVQARTLARLGEHVYVKIPVTNTRGEFSGPLLSDLAADGVRQNVTAMMTVAQVDKAAAALADGPPSILSVFAGRIADTGRDPVPLMADALDVLRDHSQLELLWASPRELLNLVQADGIGCHIITMTNDLLAKLDGLGKDLEAFSLETVEMFRRDAIAAGYRL
jgi:transaldolase